MWEFSLVDRVVFEIIKSDTYFEFISVFVSLTNVFVIKVILQPLVQNVLKPFCGVYFRNQYSEIF